ncbi:MAG: hypothetical protein ACJ0DF_13655 [Paracoccaceae bacterium]
MNSKVRYFLYSQILFAIFLSLATFSKANEFQEFIEKSFGERFYSIYSDTGKLGYIVYKLSQNGGIILEEADINILVPPSSMRAKFALSQSSGSYQFDKKTGLFNQMKKTTKNRQFINYNSFMKNRYFKEEMETITADYKGENFYEVIETSINTNQTNLLKLPVLKMNDYFSESNFIYSNPKEGDVKQIEVKNLDFKKGIFVSETLTLKQKFKIDIDGEEKYQFLINSRRGSSDTTLLFDHYGQVIEGEIGAVLIMQEPKEQALVLEP